MQKLIKHSLALLLAGTLALSAPATFAQVASLNLRDVDIRVLIDTVADVTEKNFLVDPRIKAKVTVVSSKPMDPDELYEVFLSILEVHGYAAIQSGEVIKIVPDSTAKSSAPSEGDWDSIPADEVITRVIEVKHVDASKLVPILRPLVPQNGHLAAYPQGNSLVMSDRAANVQRIMEIVNRIDQADQGGIEVIRLQHASAEELVSVVISLEKGKKKDEDEKVTLVADTRTNSVLLSGNEDNRLRIRGLIAHLDTPVDANGATRVIFVRYAKAKALADILKGVSEQEGKKVAKRRGDGAKADIDIQADEDNNALVITAPPDEMRNLEAVIRQLDIPRAQVLIEAVIAEVSTDLSEELGTQFAVGNVSGDTTTPLGLTNLGPNRLVDIASAVAGGTVPSIGAGAFLGLGKVGGGGTNWAVLVSALSGDAATNILSTPTLVATDNEEAEIVVGQNVPFVTGQYTNNGTGVNSVNPFQTIERQDIGITLRFTPQINEGDSIRLEIEQEVSSLASTSVSTSDVVTNKRSINTTVTAADGQIVVLGGLIEDRFTDSRQQVPLLGDLPIVGGLFSYTTTNKIKQNLMVFLRPVILTDRNLASAYAARKYKLIRGRQVQAQMEDRGLLDQGAHQMPGNLEQLFEQRDPPPPPPTEKAPEPAEHGNPFLDF